MTVYRVLDVLVSPYRVLDVLVSRLGLDYYARIVKGLDVPDFPSLLY